MDIIGKCNKIKYIMATVITINAEKGGVGKSTLAANLSVCLSEKKKKVLLIDLDGQTTVTKGFGVEGKTVFDALENGVIETQKTEFCVDVLAGDGGVFLQAAAQSVDCLDGIFSQIRDMYDYIVLDTAPSLTPLNISAYCNSDYILVPALYELGALDGVRGVEDNIKNVKENFDCQAELLGISLQRYNSRRNIHKIINQLFRDEFKDEILNTIIPECTAVSESYLMRQPVVVYSPKCKASEAYRNLTKEIVKRIKK